MILTTDAFESVNAPLRKIIKYRNHSPTGDAAGKLLWRALRTVTAAWGHELPRRTKPVTLLYGDRFPRTGL
jgi:transposase-like protein